MDWTIVSAFLPETGIIMASAWAIGYMLKKTPKVPDWAITWAVPLYACIANVLYNGLTVENAIIGFLTGGFAIFGHQLFKQTKNAVSSESESDKDATEG